MYLVLVDAMNRSFIITLHPKFEILQTTGKTKQKHQNVRCIDEKTEN